jgi:ATP-dependent DNA ligase
MLARSVPEIPDVGHVEPKWDGFRTIVFRDGDEVELGSRNGRSMTRYFPELLAALRAGLPSRCVLDGEIVIARGDRLDFEALLARIHPAASRVRLLAEQTPAAFVAFDLLAVDDEALLDLPFAERRSRLVRMLSGVAPPIHLTPATTEMEVARRWFETFEGAGLDGVVAKPTDCRYLPGQRAMFKTRHERTADCVVAGFRWHKSGPVVGSLLLGLYSAAGTLQHVGVSAAFTARRRAELLDELAPFRLPDVTGHPWAGWADAGTGATGTGATVRLPGASSRWNAGKDLSWVPLRPELVCEVAYDHLEGTRFRHTARFRRWRPDRAPSDCTYDQLAEPVRYRLEDVLGGDVPGSGDG